METYIILMIAIGLPLVVGLLFRVSTAHIFASLMAGELLGRYFGHDIDKVITPRILQWQDGFGEIALIIAPVVLTGVILRRTTSKGRILLHSVPLLITGIICSAFILPLLPESIQLNVRVNQLGSFILEYNKMIIGVMIVAQLLWLWLVQGRESVRSKKHKNED